MTERPDVLSVWTLTDGRVGNSTQALGLAEALERRRATAIAEFALPPGRYAARLPDAVLGALGRLSPRVLLAAHSGSEALRPPWPDLVIGAGRRSAPLVAHLRAQHGVRAVQILAPGMSFDRFDLVAVPHHDDLAGPNVVTTLGAPGRITPGRVSHEAERLRADLSHLPDRRLAVLLGGTGRMARWRPRDIERAIDAIATLADAGWGLMVTASRRTDPALVAGLRRALPPKRHLLYAGTSAGETATPNPYPGILGLAEAVLVTADSVNMASEAASCGLPVHVFNVSEPSAKAQRFHNELAARGISHAFDGDIGSWTYTPLAEADRLGAIVLERLFPPS